MLKAVDKLPFECNKPTTEEIIPPIPIWIKPNKADALPAFFVKGANATAAALG